MLSFAVKVKLFTFVFIFVFYFGQMRRAFDRQRANVLRLRSSRHSFGKKNSDKCANFHLTANALSENVSLFLFSVCSK